MDLQVVDEETGQSYYWCETTDETTPLGSPKPKVWMQVQATDEDSEPYWYCAETGEVTEEGADCPGPYDAPVQVVQVAPATVGGGLMRSVAMGAAVATGFMIVGAIFR